MPKRTSTARMRVLTAELDGYQLSDILQVLDAKYNNAYNSVKMLKQEIRYHERMMKEITQVRKALLR